MNRRACLAASWVALVCVGGARGQCEAGHVFVTDPTSKQCTFPEFFTWDKIWEIDPKTGEVTLFAELEDSEHGDMDKARAWLVRASLAAPDPAWVCRQCGDAAKVWSALCPKCGRFDGLEWDTPPRITALAPAGHATHLQV